MDSPHFIVRGYGRASTDHQSLSTKQQESVVTDNFEYYKRLKPGWKNAEWGGFFAEPPVTRTSKFRERPVGSLLIANSLANDVIMVANYDRIFANVVDVCDTIELIQVRGFKVLILDLDIDISTSLGQAVFKLMAVIKEMEVMEIRRRCLETASYRTAQGLPQGQLPIGWKTVGYYYEGRVHRHYLPNPEERRVARRVLRLVGDYHNKSEAARILENHKILNPRTGTPIGRKNLHKFVDAASSGFPLPNGSLTAPPIPPGAKPVGEPINEDDID